MGAWTMSEADVQFERISQGALLKRGSTDMLVIAFCSMLVPRIREFEFKGLAAQEPHSFLIVRDESGRQYYHGGVAGLGDSIRTTCDTFRDICRDLRPRHLVTIGASMGGFAATLYAYLLRADIAVAVNGLSYLDEDVAAFWGGGERGDDTMRDISLIYQQRNEEPEYTDLRQVAAEAEGPVPTIRWHFSPSNTVDVLHAAHLGGVNEVEFVAYRNSRSHVRLGRSLLKSSVLAQEINGKWSTPSDLPRSVQINVDPLLARPDLTPARAAWEWAK